MYIFPPDMDTFLYFHACHKNRQAFLSIYVTAVSNRMNERETVCIYSTPNICHQVKRMLYNSMYIYISIYSYVYRRALAWLHKVGMLFLHECWTFLGEEKSRGKIEY